MREAGTGVTRTATTGAWLAALTAVIGVGSLAAQDRPAGDADLPYLSGRVVDEAGLLSERARSDLEARLAEFEDEAGSQVVVVTIRDLGDAPIEDYAIRLAEAWRIGREEFDDGIILLIAPNERRLRIEIGYGLEGALTDAESRRILDQVVTPWFREGDFDRGTRAGVEAILAEITGEAPPPEAAPPESGGSGSSWWPFLLFLAFWILVSYLQARARRSRSWSSRSGPGVVILPGPGRDRDDDGPFGGFGGGFGGGGGIGGGGFFGGGGSFGGGGASGGW